MGIVKTHPPVKLICAVTVAPGITWSDVEASLMRTFGSMDHLMDWYDFHHTDYYQEEMGRGLKKRMLSFQALQLADYLAEIKLATNYLEREFLDGGRRRVNLDPGYLTAAKLVLATTKDYSHRIYLGRGIFGDLHLRFEGGRFRPQAWTYPDYREPFVLEFFNRVRQTYLQQLGEAG